MAELRTDFKDDIYQGNRKYIQVKNEDGTVSFQDVTQYEQEGDYFGAKEINIISQAVNEAFQSASDGKQKIATAITGKGVPTSSSDTFQKMADNIESIETDKTGDATAIAGDILQGKTAYAKGNKLTGSMPNRGAASQSLPINGSYTIPAGYHNGSGKVTQSITTKGAQTYTPGTADQTIVAGQYLSGAQTIKGDSNLIPANILSGKSIFGVAGSVVAGKRFASGTTTSSSSRRFYSYNGSTVSGADAPYIQVSNLNLGFTPRIIFYYSPSNSYYTFLYFRDGLKGENFVVVAIYSNTYTFSDQSAPHEYLYVQGGSPFTWYAWE